MARSRDLRGSLRRVALALLGGLALLAAPPGPALACACCVSPGYRYEGTRALSEHERGEVAQVEFTASAGLYVSEAGLEAIKGIKGPSELYRLEVEKGSRWVLRLRDEAGRSGTLAFALARAATWFVIDPRESAPAATTDAEDDEDPRGRDPSLYKELRFAVPIEGSGIFADGAKRARATFILHGRGNHCFSAIDLTHWTLVVAGPRASFTLLGRLRQSAARQ